MENQKQYLRRKYAPDFEPDSPQPMRLAGVYEDPSSAERCHCIRLPPGSDWLTIVPLGAFDVVVVDRLDRLGRTARVLLDGHDQLARFEGKFINGPVPYGYEANAEYLLIPSSRWVARVGMSEADLVRKLFTRISHGHSTVKLALWLKAAGVPAGRRHFNRRKREGRVYVDSDHWSPTRIMRTISNPTHKGTHIIKS